MALTKKQRLFWCTGLSVSCTQHTSISGVPRCQQAVCNEHPLPEYRNISSLITTSIDFRCTVMSLGCAQQTSTSGVAQCQQVVCNNHCLISGEPRFQQAVRNEHRLPVYRSIRSLIATSIHFRCTAVSAGCAQQSSTSGVPPYQKSVCNEHRLPMYSECH